MSAVVGLLDIVCITRCATAERSRSLDSRGGSLGVLAANDASDRQTRTTPVVVHGESEW